MISCGVKVCNRLCNLCNDPRKLIDSVLAERVKSAESRQSKSADSVAMTWHLPGIYINDNAWNALDCYRFKMNQDDSRLVLTPAKSF